MLDVDKIHDDIIKTGFYKDLDINKLESNDMKYFYDNNDKLSSIICLEFFIQRNNDSFDHLNRFDKFYSIYRYVFNVLENDSFDYLEIYENVLNRIVDKIKPEFTEFFKDVVRFHKLEKIFSNK